MSGQVNAKEQPETVRYGIEKCRAFIRARTSEEALAALWHVSQLVHVLPDELAKDVVKLAVTDPDFRVRVEVCYLAARWDKPEIVELLRPLENDASPEVREALIQLQTLKGRSRERIEELKDELLRRSIKERDSHRVGQFIAAIGVGSGVLLVLCVIFAVVGAIYKLPYGLILGFSYVLGALGIEGVLVTVILLLKQKAVEINERRF